MVLMALDHARDFLHAPAMAFSPEDLTRTTPALFMTRWITHVCAPTFALLAGMSIFCKLQGDGVSRLRRSLLARGLWLVLLELTVMRIAMNFTMSSAFPLLMLVLTALGLSMLGMAALIHLRPFVVLVLASTVLLLHNLLDPVRAADFGSLGPVWRLLHEPGVFIAWGQPVVVGYPVLPWIAIMAAGFGLGPILFREPSDRQRVWLGAGVVLIGAFVLLRWANGYGDPAPWSTQRDRLYTLLSFLRTTKYPPSLAFTLMTIGPALCALAWLDRRRLSVRHPLVVLGRVPLFFYVAHFAVLHGVAWVAAWLQYGAAALEFIATPFPSMGGSAERFPADFGFSLPIAYLGWFVVVALYPVCRWVAALNVRRHERRFSW
jgi:uncharacterized membrane protein